MTHDRRRGGRRRVYGRRKADFWTSLATVLGLIAAISGALVAQAELVGEPWRHVLSVLFIAGTAGGGYLLGPQHLKTLWRKDR